MNTTEILLIFICVFIAINTIAMCVGLYKQHVNHSYVHKQLRTPTGSILEVGSFPSHVVSDYNIAETSLTAEVKTVVEPGQASPDSEMDEWSQRMSAATPTSLRFMRDFYSDRVRGIDTILASTVEMTETPAEPPMEKFEIVPGSVRESKPRESSVC